MARLVALGDAHLGRTHLAHVRDEQGRNVREEDFLRSFDWAVQETIRLEPDGFVWLGDIFDQPRPTYRTFSRVLIGLKTLREAGLRGVAISGNHDTPRLRGTGSPYQALEEVFDHVEFAWALESRSTELAGVSVHAVPHTLTVEDFRTQLDAAAGRIRADRTNLAIAHVALTSVPARYDLNEIEVEEGAFDGRFDLLLLGHYHVFQKVSGRSWYAGSTDSFTFADRPTEPKGLVVVETDDGRIEHVENPNERPLVTYSVEAAGRSPGELVDAVERAAAGAVEGAIVRVYLEHCDPAAYRQVGREQFAEAVPQALHVQVEPEFGQDRILVQGASELRPLDVEWAAFVERADLSGVDRERVVTIGAAFLRDAQGDSV
jgi:DNA repair exonuclease SbcCD nuclease subunit